MPKKEKKKHVSPKKPEDLLNCSSYLARELVPQYLRLRLLNQTDAVALYVIAGIIEFGREQKSFYESRGAIARALGLPKKSVKTYLDRLMEDGIIVRTGEADAPLEERPWSAPGLTSPSVSSVLNTTLETEKVAGGNNAYPDGDTPSSPGEETSCSPQEGTPCGPHIRESEEKESEEVKNIGNERPRTPSLGLRSSSSFKKRSKPETQAILDSFPWGDYQLDSPEDLASFWSDFTGIWRSPSEARAKNHNGSAAEIDPMEIRRAYMTLKQMRIYKTPETVRMWLEWYIKAGGLNRSNFLTRFSKSWDDYKHIVARTFVEELRKENAAWDEELEDRYRREAGKTMPVIRFNSEFKEDEIDEVRESFRASLPGDDTIVGAISGVETCYRDLTDDANYMRWLASLAKSVPVLGPYVEVSYADRHLDFIRLARKDCDGDLDVFAEQTRDYVADRMKHNRDMLIDHGFVGARMIVFNWLDYAYYFDLAPGIEEILHPSGDAEGEDAPSERGSDAP